MLEKKKKILNISRITLISRIFLKTGVFEKKKNILTLVFFQHCFFFFLNMFKKKTEHVFFSQENTI